MAKKFTFRGKSAEELQALDAEQALPLLTSRARRAVKRGATRYKKLLEKAKRSRTAGKKIRTHLRDAVILPEMLGMMVAIHNGKEFIDVEIKPEMIGHRLGEYAHTCKRVAHSGPGVGATRGSKFLPLK
jgi:small subunit ribosomal protein S19